MNSTEKLKCPDCGKTTIYEKMEVEPPGVEIKVCGNNDCGYMHGLSNLTQNE